jgi:hypothetical protein
MATIMKAAVEKVCSTEQYLADIDTIGCQITEVLRRHEWIDAMDLQDLLHAKDRVNRIRSRFTVIR